MAFTVIDIETTGLSRYYHKITEIAAVKLENGKIINEFQSLINPEVKIPSFITRLTGIDNQMVQNAPKINHILPKFIEFLDEDVFVAHNATFDYGFMEYNLAHHHNYSLKNAKICTRKLANRMHPELSSKKLSDLCSAYSVNNICAHRAMGDAKAAAEIFSKMLKTLELKGFKDIHEIINFEKMNLKKCHQLFSE